ncbi:16S rRNA (cytosine(1402)-N(4))-methyltransferase RsmH [Oxalobacter paraformigenes]|uniref:Ribosomal RNA small subunit methyltransferase H n=1 Tax=Oxalobacter paraformigenes TaxID=556268 RepID=C3X5I0_9BURK|nr:16S rRNA (cytosine(1402)-N(4))-methyltransferase RsmH [Oxalobacter paraformigenes]EEO28466.1 S-adenosyl-methyltransferase MraW [Oxalobacter paraformigenes]
MEVPGFVHDSVLLNEAVDALDISGKRADGVYLDGTFGRGGHSRLILERLGEKGRLVAFDKDPEAVRVAKEIGDPRFEIVHGTFAALEEVLEERKIKAIDGILLDLGVSSPQVEDAKRGFSFRLDGPLDMRMDSTRGMSAREWLAVETEKKIAEVIYQYGEERFAFQIAKEIVAGRAIQPIDSTKQLAQIVARAVKTFEKGKNPATRTFQAIRIYVNRELEELEIGLEKAWQRLGLEGRMSVISFHSLEDRIVKRFFAGKATVKMPDRRLPIRASELPRPEMKLLGKIKPSAAEVKRNVRARSAILRVATRVALPEGGVSAA